MGFHYAKERQKFEITWKILREEYRRAGMDEDAINSMYDFDLEEFHSRRRYEMRSRPLSDLYHDEGTGNPKPGICGAGWYDSGSVSHGNLHHVFPIYGGLLRGWHPVCCPGGLGAGAIPIRAAF